MVIMIYLIKYNIVIYDTANSSNEFENREETFEEAMQTQLIMPTIQFLQNI